MTSLHRLAGPVRVCVVISSPWRAGALLLAGAAVLTGCGGDGRADTRSPGAAGPELSAEIVQLRRDQVLERVQVAVTNAEEQQITVERLRLVAPGYEKRGAVAKDSPIAPGTVVNLPWEYGAIACAPDGTARVGPPVVSLRVRTADGVSDVRLKPRDPERYLERIAERACAVERASREVALRFADEWRPENVDTGVRLHGTLLAELKVDQPREISQVAGAIMYGLVPDESVTPAPKPLALLSPQAPTAEIPVVAYAARCDGHTKGEIKKPYEFLVWVGEPGAREPLALTPEVTQATKEALQLACAF